MEDATLVEELAILRIEPVRRADRLGVAAHALGVIDGVTVTRLDRACECEEHALGRVQPLVQLAVPQEDRGTNEELLRVERFAQVVVGPGRDPAQSHLSVVRGGEDDDRDQAARRVHLEALAHGDPIEPRHVDVEEHEVRLLRGYRFERLDAVPGLADVVAELLEVALEQLSVRGHVVHHEHDRPPRCDELRARTLALHRLRRHACRRAPAPPL